MSSKLVTIADARAAAKRRMPRMMFDYVDGAAGSESASHRNQQRLEEVRLQPRVLVNTENRILQKSLFDRPWDMPIGIAPMGMCNLTWPGADRMLAEAAVKFNIPVVLSTMASSSIEATFDRAGSQAWFQLYVGQSEEAAYNLVDRASDAGCEVLILTVDVPVVAARPRELRNGFQAPVKIGPSQFLDFATHPQWSVRTLLSGVPTVANNAGNEGGAEFHRSENRGRVDWDFLDRLRQHWKGRLVVKGVLFPEDAIRIRDAGADAVYVSNHGGRQLDSAPAAIDCLPSIREVVGADYPLLFDSGIRSGESVVKALALGADFVFLGRPFLYGIGAAGQQGLEKVITILRQDMDFALAQLGRTNIAAVNETVLAHYPSNPRGQPAT